VVLETPKLVRSLFMTIPKSVPNFIIFPCSLHRAAIDSHWKRRRIIIIIIIIIINIAASSNYRGQARERPIGGGAERQEQYGRNRMYMEKTDKFRSIVVQN